MVQTNRFKSINIFGMGIFMAIGNATIANANITPSYDSFSSRDLIPHSFPSQTSSSSFDYQDIQDIAQASSAADIIKPPQQPISSIQRLNPNPNPLSLPTQAEEVEVDIQEPITLEQAIELSITNNRDIEEARIQVERSVAEVREARAALFPTLDLDSGLNYGDDAFFDSITEQNIDDRAEELQSDNPNLTDDAARDSVADSLINSSSSSFDFNTDVTLSYDIYDGGFRSANIRSAQKQLRSDELNLEVVMEQTRFETSRDYYSLQNNDAQVEIEKAAIEDATQTLKDAQLLETSGLGTTFDTLRAEVELAQAQQRLSTAIANQNIARRQLAETLSISHNSDLATADAIKEAGIWSPSLPETIIQAFENRAELEQLLLQREISEEQRQIALSQIRPVVSVSASYGVNDDFEDDFDLSDSYTVGLNLQWRLFDGGAARAGARQSERDSEIAETQFADQRNRIRFGVEQAYFSLESNQKNIATATREVDLAEESLRLARLRFTAGVGTQTDVIEAQTNLTTSRGGFVTSIINYNQSYVDLKRQVSNIF
ncbi:MAG: TolC family protein [Cyanobacteria bacterium J06631_2]